MMAATVGRPAMMAPHLQPAPAPVPSLDAIRDRADFENAMRLWSLGVRFATRDLVALGRPFEIHLSTTAPLEELAPLGFELTALFGSHVMCVKDAFTPRMAAARVVCLQGAPVAAGVSSLDGIRIDDFLVGINGDDLLLAPSTGLAQVRKRIVASCNTTGVVTLRFVRLDASVQVDPTRQVTHGSVLRVLETLQKNHDDLKASYDRLLSRNRAVVTQRLTRHKKLLGFGVHKVQELQTALQEDERFRFAAQFQQWYAAMMAETEYKFGGDIDGAEEVVDVDSDAEMEPAAFEINDDVEIEEEEKDGQEEEEVMPVPPVVVNPSLPPAQPRPADIDLRWRPILRAQEMKWLPNADATLNKFIESLVEGFTSDGVWMPEIATCSRSIVERLVVMYTAKLRSSLMDNASVKREFAQHARMLRSNITNSGNQQLRHDVLSGIISVEVLCNMTSEQLAPKALQENRQRRYEQHAKEITLTTPTGPVLVKTKHGYKELIAVGAVLPVPPTESASVSSDVSTTIASLEEQAGGLVDSTASPTTGQTSGDSEGEATSIPPVAPTSSLAPTVPVPPKAAYPGEEVTQKLSDLGVNVSALKEQRPPPPLPRQEPSGQPLPELKPTIIAPTLETVKFTTEDFRTFLKVLFDPNQHLEEMVGQLQSVVHSTSLSTMSNEFVLASGVKLYRDVQTAKTQRGGVQFRARVRVLNWKFQQVASSDREATMHVLHQLVKEFQECRRLVGRLLDQLRDECGFPQAVSNHRAHHRAMDLLVRERINIAHQVFYRRGHDGRTIEDHRDDAWIDSIEIATVYADSVNAARDRALRSAAAFLSELVAVRNKIVHPPPDPPLPPSPPPQLAPRDNGNHHFERDRFERDRYHNGSHYTDNSVQFEENRFQTDHNNGYDRKRPFDHTNYSDVGQPAPVRRKIEAPTHGVPTETGSRGTAGDPPLFFTDSKGEAPRRAPVDPNEKERLLKEQVETYQELLRAVFRNRKDVQARVQFDWNPDVPELVIEWTNRLKVTRTVSRLPGSGMYVCTLQGMDGNVFFTNSNASLDAAANYVTQRMKEWLDYLYADWSQLTDTYIRIMERKFLQRGNQADASLSAGNETRKDRSVNTFTKEQEFNVGSSAEYRIMVRTHVVVRRLCLNMKMAKRGAGEEFRDLLEWIKKTRLEAVKDPTMPISSASSVATSKLSPAPAPAPPKKASNMIACSDDSDDDDDDYYNGGGAYSDDDDWHPQSNVMATATKALDPNGGSVRSRVAAILRDRYPIESEAGSSDDARFRAVLRSLFTPEDALCTGISQIRGALKYQGQFHTTLVPNVKASIRLELLRGETFNVFASVNDVIHCKATASSKPDACDKAVNGILRELDKTRQVWTELIHFYHTKELSNNDPMDTFNKLRLANITKIDTRTEPPPTVHPHNRVFETKMASDVHCVVYFGDHVVYRVSDAVESDVHTIATARALRFLIDLIDKGLDPTPLDEPDHRFAPMPDAHIRCTVDLQDLGNRKTRKEYHADARWAIRGRVPPTAFGLPERLTLRQHDRVQMHIFERDYGSASDPDRYYFRLEATYGNGKFVNHVAEYGHKNKYRAFVLKLEIVENMDFDVYVFPPGASVNSTNNLYWSRKAMPSEIDDFKAVYGYVVRRRPPQ